MGTERGGEVLGIPSFATVRCENGVTEYRVGATAAKWLKRSLIATALLLAALIVLLASVPLMGQTGALTQGWWIFVPLGWLAVALCVLILFVVGGSCLLISSVSGEVIFDGAKLHLRDRGGGYEIPVGDVLGVRHVAYPGSRLEIDISGPPKRLFFRARRTVLEVTVPDGRIEFFGMWEEPKVAWLVSSVNRLLFPQNEPTSIAPVVDCGAETVVTAGGLYGKSWRWSMRATVCVGVIMSAISGWYACLGLNSRSWPARNGHVIHSLYEVDSESNRDTTYKAELSYSYDVLGKIYTNDDLGFGRDASDQVVRNLIENHPDGSPIKVYYDPSLPRRSIVIQGVGPVDWLFCGISILPLFSLLPLRKPLTTAAEDALARKYRTGPIGREGTMNRLAATTKWTMPYDAWKAAIRRARWAVLPMSSRTLGATALALWLAHRWAAPLCGPDFPWTFVYEIIMAFVGVFTLAKLGESFLVGRTPPSYAMGADGIIVPSKEHPVIRWQRLVRFTVGEDEHSPKFRELMIHFKSGIQRRFTLPGCDVEKAILSELSRRLPQGPPPARSSQLRQWDWLAGVALVVAVIWCGGSYLSDRARSLHSTSLVDWIMIIGFIAGPGTWIALALRTRRAADQLVLLAVILNMAGTMGVLVAAMIMHLSKPA